MALQRNLKALGTFGYQTTARAQSGVHPVHPAHAALRPQQPRATRRFGRIRELLATHVEEFR